MEYHCGTPWAQSSLEPIEVEAPCDELLERWLRDRVIERTGSCSPMRPACCACGVLETSQRHSRVTKSTPTKSFYLIFPSTPILNDNSCFYGTGSLTSGPLLSTWNHNHRDTVIIETQSQNNMGSTEGWIIIVSNAVQSYQTPE